MNLYFLVEGLTEKKVYPKWLSYLLPTFTRVDIPEDASQNNYYLISGGGFPSLLDNHLRSSLDDIEYSGNYDFLIEKTVNRYARTPGHIEIFFKIL